MNVSLQELLEWYKNRLRDVTHEVVCHKLALQKMDATQKELEQRIEKLVAKATTPPDVGPGKVVQGEVLENAELPDNIN